MPSSAQQPAYARIGVEFEQGRPVNIPLHRQRDARGVVPQRERRREWWWQPGPVDSYLCCFSVSCGVIFNAGYAVIFGLSIVASSIGLATTLLPSLEDQYARECGGAAAKASCASLADSIEATAAFLDPVQLLPTILIWVVNIVRGAIGVWAVLYSNARAAKLHLRSQALVYLMFQVNDVIHLVAGSHPQTSDFWTGFVLFSLVNIYFMLYHLKVIWSYHMILVKRSRRNQDSPSSDTEAAGGMIELDQSSQVV